MDRIIFLMDMNSYFASVEQVINPALRGKPIVVCGTGRTVVTTASYEARAFGVKTGMNLYEARKACPSVIPVCGDMSRYVATSLRIHRILLEVTELVEAFSIDECFMDVTHCCIKGKTPGDIVRAIKARLRAEIGITCSIGVGPNKVVAKVASKLQKPDGFVEIRREDIPVRYHTLPIESLQGVGVGRKVCPALHELGIATVGDLGAAPLDMLQARFGIVGHYLKRVGHGEDDDPVQPYGTETPAKSFGHSHTLPRDTWNPDVVRSYLRMLCNKAGIRLREDLFMGRCISFYLRYGDFTSKGRQHRLGHYIHGDTEIYDAACHIFNEEFLPLPRAVRLVGISISELVPYDGQPFLFQDMERQRKLTTVMDDINHRYGSFTVKPASVMIAERFGYNEGCGMVPRKRYQKPKIPQ